MPSNVLQKLVENSRKAIDSGVYDVSCDCENMRSNFDLQKTILKDEHPTLICEVKYASPSLGQIRGGDDPVNIAKEMVAGGAKALSVLTQPHMFSGSPENLIQIREAVNVPIFMKDIIIDTVQIDASKKMGADYVLLVQAVYKDGGVKEMIKYAHECGSKVLLEAHTQDELDASLSTDADLIGINNRSLDTLQVDINNTSRLLKDKAKSGPFVAESGIKSINDITHLHDAGASAFLVGTSIMSSSNIREAVNTLAGAY